MPPSQRKLFLVSLGEDRSDFLCLVSKLDIEKASAFSQYDEDQIKSLVWTDLGRQWPKVSDFVARFACNSRMAVCFLTRATCKNV